MKVFYLRTFLKDYQDLPKHIQSLAEKQLSMHVETPRHPSLRIKRIQGTRLPRWEGRVSRGYRFTFDGDEDTIILRRIGTHEMIDREAET